MTKKASDLIQKILEYGYLNFKGGKGLMEWDEFTRQDDELYYQICKEVNELDEGGKNND